MKILKILFPLSYRTETPKRFFVSLVCYVVIYLLGALIPINLAGLIISVYVYVGAGLLMVNYLVRNKDDGNGKE